jgi:hypothetical protein
MDIKEHMDVVGSDGMHVGTVDRLEGVRIKLTRSDSGDHEHYFLGTHLVDRVEDQKVTLSIPAAEAIAWHG